MENVLKPLPKSVLIPLGLTATAAATHAAIYKKIFWSRMTTLITSNEEMNDIMKVVTSLEKSGLLIKGVSETIKNESKKNFFFWMLLGTLGASLLGNLLTGIGTLRAGKETIRADEEGTVRVASSFNKFYDTKELSKWCLFKTFFT